MNDIEEPELIKFSRDGNLVEINRLLRDKVELEERNKKGYTALIIACYNGQIEAAKLLIKAGADINAIDKDNNSVLMGATFKGDLNIVELLLEHNANKALKNKDGHSALGFAEMFQHSDLLKILQ